VRFFSDSRARWRCCPSRWPWGRACCERNPRLPLERSALKLRLKDLNDGVRDLPQLFQKAIAAQPADDAAERLVNSSLLRVVDRDRRRFQLHALLREQARASCGPTEFENLQQSHAAALERLFEDWETRWRDCFECLPEIIPAGNFLWERKESARQTRLTYNGFSLAQRIGELDEALHILKQEESFHAGHTDRDAFDVLQRSYGNQAMILKAWGRLEEALALHKKEEAICLELGNKDGLQACYGNQAVILKDWGRLEEALALHKKQEAICLELGNKGGLGHCYWQWAWLARRQGDDQAERQKLDVVFPSLVESRISRLNLSLICIEILP
jgi:tetratricopeptide (TPR) repeat protein